MKSVTTKNKPLGMILILCAAVLASPGAVGLSTAQAVPKPSAAPPRTTAVSAELFPSPAAAADALVGAVENFEVARLMRIFGPDGKDIVLTGEFALDRQHAMSFADEAKKQKKNHGRSEQR